MGEYARRLLIETEEQEANKRRRLCYRKFEYSELPSYRELKSSGRINHERLLSAIQYYVDKTGFRFTPTQEAFRDEILATLIPTIYGDQLMANLKYIMKRFRVKNFNGVIAGIFPRREGKTRVTTIIAGCYMVTQPMGNVTSYNIFGRQAQEWLKEVADVLEVFKGSIEFGWEPIRQDVREFITIKTNYGTNRVASYPGSTAGNGNISYGCGALSHFTPSPPSSSPCGISG